MAADPDFALWQQKIFPRNLTARAATLVRGNPANARPESGVDNCHPGLEFDARNLDKAFYPGLVFSFQFLDGARLTGLVPQLLPPDAGITAADLDPALPPLGLLYIAAHFGNNPGQLRVAQLGGQDGYEVLRAIRALEDGPMMVVVGRTVDPTLLSDAATAVSLSAMSGLLNNTVTKGVLPDAAAAPVRDPSGRLLMAMFVGPRAPYVDAQGVIPYPMALPGDLTASLCAPWQWDFADCGCHYWAANKPDIVIGPGPDEVEQTRNFQRVRPPLEPPPALPVDPPTIYSQWTAGIMSQPQMISDWETLPFVIAEKETNSARRIDPPSVGEPWDKARIVAELDYLATVEHALCIEYLYGYYSLKALRDPPSTGSKQTARDLFAAAQLVRNTAVDEMRHFRWCNEALQQLGAKISLGRAINFRRDPDNKNRPPPASIPGSFALEPLTRDQLQAFIDVEAPSRSVDQGLDGIYTQLALSLPTATGITEDQRRNVAELVKLIIDEGHVHWQRFLDAQKILAQYDPETYLRIIDPPPNPAPDPVHEAALHLADENYEDLLQGLALAFRGSPADRSARIQDARLLMYNLDDIGQWLAAKGIGMRFKMPGKTTRAPNIRAAFGRTLAAQTPVESAAADDAELQDIMRAQRERIARVSANIG